jgi:hypothetical protein
MSGKIDFRPPTSLNHPNKASIFVDKPKDEVWKTMIKNIGSSFFVINNMDKESGFINVSYSGGNPCDFIECGTIISDLTNAKGHRVHSIEACSEFKQYEFISEGQYGTVDRSMKLEGRINIVIQSDEPNKTLVNVNVRYIATRSVDIYNVNRIKVNTVVDSANFDSNGMGSYPKGQGMCRATGLLEKKILDMVQN